jgi:hypothetical protein
MNVHTAEANQQAAQGVPCQWLGGTNPSQLDNHVSLGQRPCSCVFAAMLHKSKVASDI